MEPRDSVCRIAHKLAVNIQPTWSGPGPVWPLLERMRRDGAVVVVKLDGGRGSPEDNGPYTVLASGGPLDGAHIRTDAETVEAALSYVIVEYARRVWGVGPD